MRQPGRGVRPAGREVAGHEDERAEQAGVRYQEQTSLRIDAQRVFHGPRQQRIEGKMCRGLVPRSPGGISPVDEVYIGNAVEVSEIAQEPASIVGPRPKACGRANRHYDQSTRQRIVTSPDEHGPAARLGRA